MRAATVLVFATLVGCARTPREAHSAPVAGSSGAVAPAASAPAQPAAAAGDDKQLPPGLDISDLDDFSKKVFFRIANAEPSVCGKAESLLRSARNDHACRKSFYALRAVVRYVKQGYTDSEVSEKLSRRYRENPRRNIDVSQAPMEGAAGGTVVLVDFSDYECPHCKRLHQVLQSVLNEFRGEVKLYLKNYPLSQHPNARAAAEAALAAHRQGKFAAYDEKLWENSDSLDGRDLEKYAREVGLDVERWRRDLSSAEVKDRVQKDKSEGTALGLTATPMLFLNGREFTDAKDTEFLRDWINEELGR